MAAYKSDAMRNHWKKVFEIAKNVDVLNPTNTIVTRGKKFISPNSFPYIIEFNNIPAEKFTNTYRENSIIFCGSFVQQKNPLLAIEGFAAFLEKYSDSYPDARLLMFGKGNLLPVVMEKLESVNMKFEREAISIIPDTKLIDSLSISKIFLSLQDYDNYPSQSVMEAMLFGQSVLSIDNGDTWKLVQPSLDNVLIKEKDPIAVGEGIQHLLSTWQFNIQNRQLILNEFSPEKYARYFFDIHTSIS
jgi:glycosyltransferase involved in cell wall biosynthesis